VKSALVIGGWDSSGGAGVLADLRAFDYLNVHAVAALTAVTSQGINGVSAVQLVDADVLAHQLDDAVSMNYVEAVKVGMLGSGPQVRVVAEFISATKPAFVVVDPVLQSSSGATLLDNDGKDALLSDLLPLTTVLTPNLNELKLLADREVTSLEDRIEAANVLLKRGAGSVVVKGGHLDGEPDDLLVRPGKDPHIFKGHRVATGHTRGTGCLLASLIAGHLVRGGNVYTSVFAAKIDLAVALRKPFVPHVGVGYPRFAVRQPTMTHEMRLRMLTGIYFVTDRTLNPEITHTIGARLAIAGGSTIIQLREKEWVGQTLTDLSRRVRNNALAKALYIQNDSVEAALAVDADGVHLGPEDMSPSEARRILGPDKLIGVSVSTVEEARSVAEDASYLAVGAIFGSSTKGDAGEAVGVERITEIKNAFPEKKIVAIGGINLSNIASVAAAGADAAAVVSAIVCAPDPEQATRDLLAEFERGKAQRKSI